MFVRSTATRSLARAAAELLVTCGAVVLLFGVYLVFWSDVQASVAQVGLRDDFEQQVEAAQDGPATQPVAAKPAVGSGIAVMSIPRLGADWSWVVVEGVTDDQIARGPGHFPETALPGRTGNFAVAGHRATHGEPFAHLDQVQPRDTILVETPGAAYEYVVTRTEIVAPSSTGVLLPVPDRPDATPKKARITLVTCHPRWGSSERMIVHGHLQRTITGTGA
ncbi:sortase A [Mumia flava]|uniref:Sortase A n=1 Tax=Mumia flava TaxID=1348852 RepID=A0A2M9BEJ4_9ACTN|nr:class E sortase [Mumia flava]PJJ56359.1 sortase A [Mumia flava]